MKVNNSYLLRSVIHFFLSVVGEQMYVYSDTGKTFQASTVSVTSAIYALLLLAITFCKQTNKRDEPKNSSFLYTHKQKKRVFQKRRFTSGRKPNLRMKSYIFKSIHVHVDMA